jgi:hypothetical protein
MTSLPFTWGAAALPATSWWQPAGVATAQPATSWDWALRLSGLTPALDAGRAASTVAATPVAAVPIDATAPVRIVNPVVAARSLPVRRLSASGAIRRSAIPAVTAARAAVTVARGMATYRQVAVQGGARGRTVTIPAMDAGGAARVEVFAVQPHRSRQHATQVLVAVSGTRVTIPAGAEVRFLVRVTGQSAGRTNVDAGVTTVAANVTGTAVRPLPMLTWVNPQIAASRGASVAAVERTLAGFGVASTGATTAKGLPRRYVSAAWEAATGQAVGPVVERVLEQERDLATTSPGATLWVQVSDEQDRTPAQAARTARWIARLDAELERRGSHAKLFVACQPRPHTMAYAAHVDGWAVTQSAAGMSRAQSLAAVRQAAVRTGHRIEVMEYPGNALFDAGTPGSAALSTASAALDGAGAWFSYSANNLDTLEAGRGVEGRGDIGGLVTIRGGSVLPTLALAEAHYGANLGAAARALGGSARSGSAARAVTDAARTLDEYHHGAGPDLASWDADVSAALAQRG